MSDQSQGPGWWQASDSRWYPPESARSALPPPPPPPVPVPFLTVAPNQRTPGKGWLAAFIVVGVGVVLALLVTAVVITTSADRNTWTDYELTIEELVAFLEASGDTCTPTQNPLSGNGGQLVPQENLDYSFVSCETADGTLFALVTYDPLHVPEGIPCSRAEGYINGQGAWWIHQEPRGEAAGGLKETPPKEPDTLRKFATHLGGSYVDDC